MSTNLRAIKKAFENDRTPKVRNYNEVADALAAYVSNPNDYSVLLTALKHCKNAGEILYRKELWHEMLHTVEVMSLGGFPGLQDAAWHIRNNARRVGRKLPPRVVSRTLLVKGLEFDHAIIANADVISDAKNLYVALTRGARSLTVVSRSPILQRDAS
jgi:hypothetical protein